MKDILNKLKSLEKHILDNAETDCPFNISEIKRVVKDLKQSKAAGPDRIINEITKHSTPGTSIHVGCRLCMVRGVGFLLWNSGKLTVRLWFFTKWIFIEVTNVSNGVHQSSMDVWHLKTLG